MTDPRSGCPINLSVELLGDRWSLLVIRDIMFADRHTFRELLTGSDEGIASNILTDRLKRLVGAGLLTRGVVAGHRQKVRYDLTEPAVDLLPVLVAVGAWGTRYLDADPELSSWVRDLEAGGPARREAVMAEIRANNRLTVPALDEPVSTSRT